MSESVTPQASNRHGLFARSPVLVESVPYSEALALIEDGDLLLYRGKYLVSRVFQFLSRGWFSHAAIALYWDDQLMLLQADFPYIEALPLRKTVRKYDGAVYLYKLTDEFRQVVHLEKVFEEARSYLGTKFGFRDVLVAFAHRYFGRPLPPDPKHHSRMFCSEYVAHCFRAAKAPLTEREDIDTFPSDIEKSRNVVLKATLRADPEDVIPPMSTELLRHLVSWRDTIRSGLSSRHKKPPTPPVTSSNQPAEGKGPAGP